MHTQKLVIIDSVQGNLAALHAETRAIHLNAHGVDGVDAMA
jgi:hypothetical protein